MQAAKGAAGAVAFLTRLPIGRLVPLDGSDVARGAAFFPIVGAAIGAAVGGVAQGLVHVLPALAAAGIALLVGAALTGALHLDALADSADALTKGGERALAIMRDHAIGTYGTVALVLDLIVKTAALAALATHHRAVWAAIAAGALSRAVPAALGAAIAPVRADGAGAGVAGRFSRAGAAAAVVIACAVAIGAERLHGLELAGIAALGAVVLGLSYLRWLSGVTGDLLGAAAELTETGALIAVAALTGSR